MFTGMGYAAAGAETELAPVIFERGDPRADDVAIIRCGACRSDRARAWNAWRNTRDPCVPGHPIASRATSPPWNARVSTRSASRASLQLYWVRHTIIGRVRLRKAA